MELGNAIFGNSHGEFEVPEMEPIEIIPQEDGTVLANYIPITKVI